MKNNFTKYYSIAPMMGKTDSYFCYLMSFINKDIRIYTEMMHAEAIIRTNILENYKILKDFEKPMLIEVLKFTNNNQLLSSEILGINRNTLRKKMSNYDIQVIKKTTE